MPNQFFIIVEKNDSEKFRKFKIGRFNDKTNKILEKYDSNYVWGFHKAKINNSIWKKIKKTDKIFLTIPKENFKISGIVSKKVKKSNFGELIYPEDLSSKEINHFIFFDELKPSSEPYHGLIDNSTSKTILEISGIHEIKKQYYVEKKKKEKPKKFVLSKKTRGAAKRSKSEVWRFNRDTKTVQKLKELYGNKCQICDFILEYEKDGRTKLYSEVHHYWPLEEGGDDDPGNMIVMCPNHHAELDYNVIAISNDGTTIINKQGKKIGEIKFHRSHRLDIKNIEHQLEG